MENKNNFELRFDEKKARTSLKRAYNKILKENNNDLDAVAEFLVGNGTDAVIDYLAEGVWERGDFDYVLCPDPETEATEEWKYNSEVFDQIIDEVIGEEVLSKVTAMYNGEE